VTVPPRAVPPALLQVDAIVARLKGRAALAEVCRFLRSSFRHYRWVGVYRKDGETLVLDGWDGPAPTEHTRIPVGQGVCGRAARENRTVIVDDVRADPDYLACFLETRSEIVVPIHEGETVLGEVDIDGVAVGAYDASDRGFLVEVARRLIPAVRAAAAEGPPPP
jgi:L-methionine (R)-S-oxide reductase